MKRKKMEGLMKSRKFAKKKKCLIRTKENKKARTRGKRE